MMVLPHRRPPVFKLNNPLFVKGDHVAVVDMNRSELSRSWLAR